MLVSSLLPLHWLQTQNFHYNYFHTFSLIHFGQGWGAGAGAGKN